MTRTRARYNDTALESFDPSKFNKQKLVNDIAQIEKLHYGSSFARIDGVVGELYWLFFNLYGRRVVECDAQHYLIVNGQPGQASIGGTMEQLYDDDHYTVVYLDGFAWQPNASDYMTLFRGFVDKFGKHVNINVVRRYVAVHYTVAMVERVAVDLLGL